MLNCDGLIAYFKVSSEADLLELMELCLEFGVLMEPGQDHLELMAYLDPLEGSVEPPAEFLDIWEGLSRAKISVQGALQWYSVPGQGIDRFRWRGQRMKAAKRAHELLKSAKNGQCLLDSETLVHLGSEIIALEFNGEVFQIPQAA